MKLVVTGGRDYGDLETVYNAISKLHNLQRITLLINGGAKGADTLCRVVAEELGIPVENVPILPEEWKRYGNGAGPRRNQKMIDEFRPQGLIYFPGGNGTADMKRRCEKAGLMIFDGLELANRDDLVSVTVNHDDSLEADKV